MRLERGEAAGQVTWSGTPAFWNLARRMSARQGLGGQPVTGLSTPFPRREHRRIG